ncbi:MAG TPA: hypothetical protein VMW56_31605 [Candidatus Margulisiibacteriota bacterium]|nr:hypothetical protein [Candidatus Margulisiibacteriota bacterium]
MELASGIAHVSFPGGGVFLPARDPYDRQTLIEHVKQRVRAKGRVQVLVDNQRWMVQPAPPSPASTCALCGQMADTTCHLSGDYGTPLCVHCALGGVTPVESVHHEEWRQVG